MSWNFSPILSNLLTLALALWVTVKISILTVFFGTLAGVLLGVFSLFRARLIRFPTRLFIEAFLALPVLVVLIWIYYSLPLLLPGLLIGGQAAAVLGLSLSLAAFVAEIVRGGINAIPFGEVEVAYLTGMSKLETIRYIVVPQVLRKSWPSLMGQYITTYKFSTLASVIAVPEILHTANAIIAQTYRPLEIYSAVAIIFLCTVWPLNLILRRLERVKEFGGTARL